MLLSIIIPVFNEEEIIGDTIERIQHALTECKAPEETREIIVCDNNSTDRSAEIAAQLGAKVVFEKRRHISLARNAGAKSATGDWLLFIDADSYPRAELVSDLLVSIGEPDLVGCGSTVEIEGGTLFNKLRMERLNPLFRFLNLSGGAFLFCRADAFRAIGGFSDELYAYEDLDFVIRLKRYARSRQLRFTTLHRHPVVTSGRRGAHSIASFLALAYSNFAAVTLFVFRFALPRKWVRSLSARSAGYWYETRK